ncbi:MAG: GH3 auxin-responsive promoter family protein [Bacillota bacterium]|nr:GH3 auxin-responsive promoter family protein [Bacillota bacterium]MDW7677775.1 GH3 auxin-responsive promoter family protein [Bacillota bacterium]
MDFLFAVPGQVSQSMDMDTFTLETAVHLLLCRNLTLISVWNPTFIFLLLEFMTREVDQVMARVRQKNSHRAREVEEILKRCNYQSLWPHLQVISCWLDGYAAVHEKQLREWFPQVMIQPKGLLATEGFISFPFVGEEGTRLSLGSHFFEFLDSSEKQIFLAHQLEPGRTYEVILTTAGGLYRYRMKDLVEVTGYTGVFPLLKFRGKADRVSDLFGEKLHEQLIEDTLKQLDSEMNLKPLFAMAAPEGDHYVLYLQLNPEQESIHPTEGPGRFYTRLAEAFDEGLRTNFHYHHCRRLGQLKPLRVFRLTGNAHQE